ncbi:hypothetical protein JOM56_010660 [Amanita muscaria]
MSLRPPSTSPSPSPGPNEAGKISARQSMGPQARGTPGLPPASPRPGAQSHARPTSELLGSGHSIFQTPEAEALDQWFENLQNYEATLEDMAAASLDVNFKEELSAIEQWFKVLSEAERTAALYSLLQHSTQVQIRFFITVLQQMARSDPMTALLSPAMGGSMQSQMEAKLASMSLKSPGLKPGISGSPTARNFSANRQSLALDNSSNYLSPDSAADAAATLAQRRAELKASNAAHRISAPVLASAGGDGRTSWGVPQLSQVSEQAITQEIVTSARPKSTEFSGTLGSPRPEVTSDSWASMVNTPLVPMFAKPTQNLDAAAAASKLNEWATVGAGQPGVPRMGDPTIRRRNNKLGDSRGSGQEDNHPNNQSQQARGASGGRNASGGWSGTRSPALSNSNRFGNEDASGGANTMNGLGMQMGGGFNMGMGNPGMGVPLAGLGMTPMSPFNLNMLSAMGISPEAQLLAAQMAAASQLNQAGGWLGMQPLSPASQNNRRGPPSARSAGIKSASSIGSRADTPKGEEDVDPSVLSDIPGWLRSLRLHKYTPNFEGMKWQDMVMMDEAALEAKGVAALGARRKMMKTFEVVRKKMSLEGGVSAPPSATTAKPA